MKTGRSRTKRRFWLKIPANFFDHGEMLLLERAENFVRLQNIWMRLLTFCLKENPEEGDAGILRLSDKFGFDERTLAAALRVELFDFRVAFRIFLDYEMVAIGPDETIYVASVQGLIGSETDAAERQRAHRAKQRTVERERVTMSQESSQVSHQEEKRSDSGAPPSQGGGDPESEKEEFGIVLRAVEDQLRELNKRRA